MKQKKIYFDGGPDGPIPVKILKYTEVTLNTSRKQRYVEVMVTYTVFPYKRGKIMITAWSNIWTKAQNTEEGFIYSGKPAWDPEKTLEPACHDLIIKTAN